MSNCIFSWNGTENISNTHQVLFLSESLLNCVHVSALKYNYS